MSESKAQSQGPPAGKDTTAEKQVTVLEIFLEFLLIGATSFGGGVVAYLRNGLVQKRGWVTDKEFVELLAISQSLPGLNATNMAMLVGDRLRGFMGGLAALIGVCLPGGLLMFAAGMMYHSHGDRPIVTAMLKGVAAAAVGLILATVVQLSQRSLPHAYDLIFVAATVLAVNRFHQSVPRALVVVGTIAILWYHPRTQKQGGATA